MRILVCYRQTCFPDPDVEEKIFTSFSIRFDCFSRDCNRINVHGAGKIDLEPVIKAMLDDGINEKSGEINCARADITCKNKLVFKISFK